MCEPQKPACTAGLPCSVPFSVSTPSSFWKYARAGEDQMLVAGEDRVDAVDAGDMEPRSVFHPVAGADVDAGVRQAR